MRAFKILGTLAAMVFATQANAIVIDTFKRGDVSVFTPGMQMFTAVGATLQPDYFTTIGNSRFMKVQSGNPAIGTVGSNKLVFSSNASGGILRVRWGNNGAGLGGVNLAGVTLVTEVIEIMGSVDFRWIFEDTGAGSTTINQVGITGIGLVETTLVGGSANFASIDAIELQIRSVGIGEKIGIDVIASDDETGVIPEPSILAVIGASVVGIAAMRRRRS